MRHGQDGWELSPIDSSIWALTNEIENPDIVVALSVFEKLLVMVYAEGIDNALSDFVQHRSGTYDLSLNQI